jgi:hypothetical protein
MVEFESPLRGLLGKAKELGNNWLENQRYYLSKAAENPDNTRRLAISSIANKFANRVGGKDNSLITNTVLDLDELANKGDTKLSRRGFLGKAGERIIRRSPLNPDLDITKDPVIKRVKNSVETVDANLKLPKNKKVKGGSVADRAVENLPEDALGIEEDLLDLSYGKKYIYFSMPNVLPELVIGGGAGLVQGATYVGAKAATGEYSDPESARNELIANTAAGATSLTGGTLLARAAVNKMMKGRV